MNEAAATSHMCVCHPMIDRLAVSKKKKRFSTRTSLEEIGGVFVRGEVRTDTIYDI